jgi:hypothetical protein
MSAEDESAKANRCELPMSERSLAFLRTLDHGALVTVVATGDRCEIVRAVDTRKHLPPWVRVSKDDRWGA